jgi:hypothetical protein
MVFLFTYANSQIRNTTWGNSKAQVKQIEGKKPIAEKPESLLFIDEINGDKHAIHYEFIDNRLISILYIYNEKHSNPNFYINKYNEYVDVLNDKYVKDDEEIEWSNDLFKDESKSWGLAVSIGHLKQKYFAHNETTDVKVILMGDNYKVILGITFTDINAVELKRQKLQKQRTKNF